MSHAFRWKDYNLAKIAKHGLDVSEVESVVTQQSRNARGGSDGKWYVKGATRTGRWIEVIYVINDGIFVIHARPLDEKERRRARRR